MSAHTPGPWVVAPSKHSSEEPRRLFVVWEPEDGDNDGESATVCSLPATQHMTREADARLIASAPDLLAACENALKWLACDEPEEAIAALRAAIAKARNGGGR